MSSVSFLLAQEIIFSRVLLSSNVLWFRGAAWPFVTGCALVAECYAVMPPLERFLEVPREERRELFFRDIERGDIVIGRITSIREFGFFMVLICLGSGVIREIADLEITVRYSFGQ